MDDDDDRVGATNGDDATATLDLQRIGEALIKLEGWSRMRGHIEVADRLDSVATYVERCLVR